MIDKIRYFFQEFLPEVRGEWRKVTRPSQKEVLTTTSVVIVTSFIFAAYLALADIVIRWVYEGIFKVLGLS